MFHSGILINPCSLHTQHISHSLIPLCFSSSLPALLMFFSPSRHLFCHAQSIPLLVQTLPPEFLPLIKYSLSLSLSFSFLIFTLSSPQCSHLWNAEAVSKSRRGGSSLSVALLPSRFKGMQNILEDKLKLCLLDICFFFLCFDVFKLRTHLGHPLLFYSGNSESLYSK